MAAWRAFYKQYRFLLEQREDQWALDVFDSRAKRFLRRGPVDDVATGKRIALEVAARAEKPDAAAHDLEEIAKEVRWEPA